MQHTAGTEADPQIQTRSRAATAGMQGRRSRTSTWCAARTRNDDDTQPVPARRNLGGADNIGKQGIPEKGAEGGGRRSHGTKRKRQQHVRTQAQALPYVGAPHHAIDGQNGWGS